MARRATRKHVFRLTDDAQAAVDLWHQSSYPSQIAFAKALGISCHWFVCALQQAREIAIIESDQSHAGFSSLSVARGAIRMAGTR